MSREKIIAGIAVYKTAQDELLKAIEDRGGRLSQRDFDSEFHLPKRFPVTFLEPHSYILGGFQGHWAKYLQLLQPAHKVKVDLQADPTGTKTVTVCAEESDLPDLLARERT